MADTAPPAGADPEAQPVAEFVKGMNTTTAGTDETPMMQPEGTDATAAAGQSQSMAASFKRSAKNVAVHTPFVLLIAAGTILVSVYLGWAVTSNNYPVEAGNRRTWSQWIAVILIFFYAIVAFLLTSRFPLPYNPAFHGFATAIAWTYAVSLGDAVIDTKDLTTKTGYYNYVRVGFAGWVTVVVGLLIIMFFNITPGVIWEPAAKKKKETS